MSLLMEQYGPGMSFYRAHLEERKPKPRQASTKSSLVRYANALESLAASNEALDKRMKSLRSGALRLKFDLIKFQRHLDAFDSDLLVTWQADTLTRLIEVIYEVHRWKMPGGVTSKDHAVVDRNMISKLYEVAARKVKRETLRMLGVSVQYYHALQKYDEIVHFRSLNPFQSECPFARWLISKKTTDSCTYIFWGALFPMCYGRTVEEASEIF
ncbi:hypothetical protein BDV59DRAFT_157964 [Aspergillus ambiguus]|uniref:uncharacterized protein n=1 Tax=Aspergillus ambiguus TaxID=176160 RepID=UPI003CCC9E1A